MCIRDSLYTIKLRKGEPLQAAIHIVTMTVGGMESKVTDNKVVILTACLLYTSYKVFYPNSAVTTVPGKIEAIGRFRVEAVSFTSNAQHEPLSLIHIYFADMALPPVMNDELKFYPAKYKNTYRHWMENIKDWCISCLLYTSRCV